MEIRYVYRRLEDDIGAPRKVANSPHARLAQRLRFDVRELKDLQRYSEVQVLSLSSIAGNSSLDIDKVNDKIAILVERAFERTFPYFKKDDEKKNEPEETNYDKYFAELDRMDKEIEDSKSKEENSKKQNITD